MSPATLLESQVVVIGGIEVGDKSAAEVCAEVGIDLVVGASTNREVAVGLDRRDPEVTILSVLSPARLNDMHHRTSPHRVPYRRDPRRTTRGHGAERNGNPADADMDTEVRCAGIGRTVIRPTSWSTAILPS